MMSFSDICPMKDKKKEEWKGGRKEEAQAIQSFPTQKLLCLFAHNTLLRSRASGYLAWEYGAQAIVLISS